MNFSVETTQLGNAAKGIQTKADAFQSLYTQIYECAEGMQKAWQGQENTAFTAKISGFRPKLDELRDVIRDFGTLAAFAKEQYEKALGDATNAANAIG